MYDIIINGDTVEEMNKLPPNSVDLIFADPPYWMRTEGVLHRFGGTEFDGCDDHWDKFSDQDSYNEFTKKWLLACKRLLKPDASLWVIGGMQCIYSIGGIMQDLGFWIINDVVWHKKNPTPNFKGTRLNNSHETLIWATQSPKALYTFNYKTAKELNRDTVTDEEFRNGVRKQMGSVWRFPVCSGRERLNDESGNKLHNTQKPLELLERIITISSKIGDVVLDPFGGTMTTGVATKKLGRKYIMIERDEKYCKFGKIRLESTQFQNSDLAKSVFDEKPKKVTVEEMIRDKYLLEGEYFYLKDKSPVAVLCPDGKLLYQNQVLDMHTCVALAKGVKADRLNGFAHWYVERNGKLVPISEIRENYRNN